MRQKVVLLCFVEMMNLVNEQHGRFAKELQVLGFLDDFFQFFDPRIDRGKMYAGRSGRVGQNSGQRRLAAAGRAPEYQRTQLASADDTAQEFSRTEQMLLADEFRQRFRTHSLGERLVPFFLCSDRRVEEIHDYMLAQMAAAATGGVGCSFRSADDDAILRISLTESHHGGDD